MKEYCLYYYLLGDDDLHIKEFTSWEYMTIFIKDNYDKIDIYKYSTDNYESSETYHE